MTTFLEFASRGKNAWWRYLVSSILAVAITVFMGVVIILCLEALHFLPKNLAAELLRPSHPIPFLVGAGAIFGMLLVGFVAAIAFLQDKHFGDVVGSWNWTLFSWGFCIWALVQIIASLLDFLIAPHDFKITVTDGTPILAIYAVLGLSVQTFAEEFIFRGYLTQGFLLATKRPLGAAVLSGILFGALHIPNGTPQAVNALIFGIVTSLIAIRTGSIAFSFGLHLMNNVFGAAIVVAGNDVFKGSPGLITQNSPQLLWWDIGVTAVALVGMLWLTTKLANSDRSSQEIH